jgi:hypothetical protein
LYGCFSTWGKSIDGLRAAQNRALRGILEPKRQEVTGGYRNAVKSL